MHGVAARLVALDVHGISAALEPRDLRVDVVRGLDRDAEVLAAAGLCGGVQVGRELEAGLLGDEQRVVGELLRGLRAQQCRVERDAASRSRVARLRCTFMRGLSPG